MTAAESAELAQRYDPVMSRRNGKRAGRSLTRSAPVRSWRIPGALLPGGHVPVSSGDLHMGHAEAYPSAMPSLAITSCGAATCCTRSAGMPSACLPRTPRSGTTPTRPTGRTQYRDAGGLVPAVRDLL